MKCIPPGAYGLDNLKKLKLGSKPIGVSCWPCELLNPVTQELVRNEPLTQFEAQVRADHPSLSMQEVKIVAATLIRCAEHAAHSNR